MRLRKLHDNLLAMLGLGVICTLAMLFVCIASSLAGNDSDLPIYLLYGSLGWSFLMGFLIDLIKRFR